MSQLNSTPRSFSNIYNFAVDGGAVSTINLGTFFKPNTKIQNYNIQVLTAFTSGGAATVSIGATGLATTTFFNGVAVATLALNYVATVTNTIIVVPSTGSQLTITIATAALTAGRLIFSANCLEMDV